MDVVRCQSSLYFICGILAFNNYTCPSFFCHGVKLHYSSTQPPMFQVTLAIGMGWGLVGADRRPG
jgi:hypothetical protein